MQKRGKNQQLSTAQDGRDSILQLLLGELSDAAEATALASLPPDAKAEIDGDLEALAALSHQLGQGMPTPRRALKERVIAAAIASEGEVPAHIVREADETWLEDPALPGIRMKILNQDPTSGVITALARLEPGTTYPAHRHVGPETCYVISGDLHVNDTDLEAGDFIANPDGAEHLRTYSIGGCYLLLASSFKDQFFSPNEAQ